MGQSTNPGESFYAHLDAEELIARQNKGPIADPTVLLGDFWPEDEPVEDFLAALDEWRGHRKSDRAA